MVANADIMSGAGGLGLGLEAIGLVGGMFEAGQAANVEKQISQQSMDQAQYEEQITGLRQQQMMLFSNRQSMESLRQSQKIRAQGIAAATSSGAQFGSGTKGAQGEAAATQGQSTRNLNQDVSIGRQIFGLTGQIDESKIQSAQLGGQLASIQGTQSIFGGLSGLGGGLVQSANPLSQIFGGG